MASHKNMAQSNIGTQQLEHSTSQQATLSQVVLFMAQFLSVYGLNLFIEQA
jgi:hypothetical protein